MSWTLMMTPSQLRPQLVMRLNSIHQGKPSSLLSDPTYSTVLLLMTPSAPAVKCPKSMASILHHPRQTTLTATEFTYLSLIRRLTYVQRISQLDTTRTLSSTQKTYRPSNQLRTSGVPTPTSATLDKFPTVVKTIQPSSMSVVFTTTQSPLGTFKRKRPSSWNVVIPSSKE